MYHQEPHERTRSRRREKPRCSNFDPLGRDLSPANHSYIEGNVQFRKRIYPTKVAMDSSCGNDFPAVENSFAQEFRRRSTNKATGTVKTLIDEEMPEEIEIRRPSPGVVAKLMGLDAMPPPHVVPKQWKETGNFRKTSSASSQEKYTTYDGYTIRMSNREHQEFKDVFEVIETSKAEKHRNQTVRKGLSSLKEGETDPSFTKKNFMESKYLPVDETVHDIKEFHNGKDLFLKLLHEPNSLFTKHLHDLKSSPPSRHGSHITILKSSKDSKNEALISYRKPATSYACQSLIEHSCYLPDKLPRSRYGGKVAVNHHPTRIVVLKSSLEKAQDMARTLHSARYHEDSQVMAHKAKSSREIAREVAEQVRFTASCSGEKVTASKINGHWMDESSCSRSAIDNLKKSEALHSTSDHFDEYGNSFGASSSVNREARKRMSERWRMSHLSQEVRPVGRASNTLGEMLALSDKDTQNQLNTRVPKKEVARDEELVTWDRPLGNLRLSSRNHIGGSKNCSVLKDVLDMGFNDPLDGKFDLQRNSKVSRVKHHTNRAQMNSFAQEYKLPEREIHVNSEELRKRAHMGYLAKERAIIPERSDTASADRRHMIESSPATEYSDMKFSSKTYKELVKLPGKLTMLAKETSMGDTRADSRSSLCSISESGQDSLSSPRNISELGSPGSLDKADRPSPVSVLEPPEEEKADSGCFKKITADLQDLRMQLQLLKSESSDEEIWEECHTEILQVFRDEEERDFSYLLDIIIESGVRSSVCRSPECPAGVDVFDRLEKKYSSLVSWARTERKLLFDLINTILADNVVGYMDIYPCVNPKRRRRPALAREDFVEEVWQMVVNLRKAQEGDLQKPMEVRWLDLGGDIDLISSEIGRLLEEDLFKELASELILR